MHMFLIIAMLFRVSTVEAQAYSVESLPRGFIFAPTTPPAAATPFTPILVSRTGEFAAGFLRDTSGRFTFSVVGVDRSSKSNSSVKPLDTVWMANRDSPVEGTPLFIFRNDTGNLRVGGSNLHPGRESEGSSWESSGYGGLELRLRDSGNLILLGASNSTVWQSFDHPAEVLMQGQNFTQEMRLVSSVSTTDSASGVYRMRLLGDRMILFAGSEPYWATASLKEHDQSKNESIYIRIEEGFLGMYQSEVRIFFQPFSSMNRVSGNFTRRGRVSPNGNLVIYYWQDGELVEDYSVLGDPCKFPDSCGSYGVCSGSENVGSCKCPEVAFVVSEQATNRCRSVVPEKEFCGRSSVSDEFLEIRGVDYLPNDLTSLLDVPSAQLSKTLEECRRICLGNCGCMAFFYRNDSGACFHTESLRSMQTTPNSQDVAFIRLISATHSSTSRIAGKALGLTLLVLVAVLGSSSVVLGLYYVRRRSKRDQDFSDEEVFLDSSSGLPKRFTYSEIQSSLNRSDYHRRFNVIRIEKQLSVREFKSEVAAVASTGSHPNLVTLLGYCMHEGSFYLVYDNKTRWKSLELLVADQQDVILDWKSKMRIVEGIARGLAFIHGNSYRGVGVHGNVVAGNVMVDENLDPKLLGYGAFVGERLVPSDDVSAFGLIVQQLLKCGESRGRNEQEYERLVDVAKRCSQPERLSMSLVADTISRSRGVAAFSVG